MVCVIRPPEPLTFDSRPRVFLAGTIDDGQSVDWQQDITNILADLDIVILNPRRNEWDASWEQSISNPQFREQVEWELQGLEQAAVIFFYFAPNSKSPIFLLELGLHAKSNKLIIVCPTGFWRLGNVEVVANKYRLPLYKTMASGAEALRRRIYTLSV